MQVVGIVILIIILAVILVFKFFSEIREDKRKLQTELESLRTAFINERERAVKSEQALLAQREKQLAQEAYLNEFQQRSRLDFEHIASKILEEKSKKFIEHNRNNLDIILNPLRENIKTFEEKVEKVYKSESDERNVLKGVIGQLMEQSRQIQEDANNLTRALKGDTKKQGNWGEVILERILERSGLEKGREYRAQASITGDDGGRQQPDVIIDLPDDKHIIIDAKVSLTAYERMVTAESEEEREHYLKQHILSIKAHIQGLAARNYQELQQLNCPDFVMLFLPIESSFGIAVQQDAELFNYAWDRKVVIVSPSTLLATLRTISSIWKQERQNRNVLEIARLGGSMYDKFVGFLTDMESIGRNIRQSQDAYEKAIGKLSAGPGNLAVTSEKIRKLGAKATKRIDSRFLGEPE